MNLLLAAYDTSNPKHETARSWLQDALSGEEQIGLALTTLLAFVRIGTDPRVFDHPLSTDEATDSVSGWLSNPGVTLVQPTPRHWPLLATVAREGQARGPLMMDAHLAALAIEHGAVVHTNDRDFARFPGTRFTNPIA